MCGSMGRVSTIQAALSHERSRHDFAAAENSKNNGKDNNCEGYERPHGGLNEEPDEKHQQKRTR